VQIEGEILEPRKPLNSVPYAFRSTGPGDGNTLDGAYNQGGPGAGRQISVHEGLPVELGGSASDKLAIDGGYLKFYPEGSDDYVAKFNGYELRMMDDSNWMETIVRLGGAVNDYGYLDLSCPQTGAEIFLGATNGGGGRPKLEMDSPSYSLAAIIDADESDGGGGRLKLSGPYGTFEVDTNGPFLRFQNSRGETTIEIDWETGNICYTGELVKKQ